MNRFKVVARLDHAFPTTGTILIDRVTSTFGVRPHRRKRVFTLPLAIVAEIVVTKIIKAEIAEKRAARKRRK